jgi:methane monooxygenase PmoA-like
MAVRTTLSLADHPGEPQAGNGFISDVKSGRYDPSMLNLCALALIASLSAGQDEPPPVPRQIIKVSLGAQSKIAGDWSGLQQQVMAAGAQLNWLSQVDFLLAPDELSLIAFVQAVDGNSSAQVSLSSQESEVVMGDLILLRAGQTLYSDQKLDLLVFARVEEWDYNLPSFIRPDFDPLITDTPGGCATEAGAYRRVLLTWQGKNGPYLDRLINAHRVRIRDSFSHYHPLEGGFDEIYLVQDALPGAELIVSEKLTDILNPDSLSPTQAVQLLRHIPLRKNDLVFLPRGTMHRGVGGVLAQVITLPGFIPGAEIPLDQAIQKLNQKFKLNLPSHQPGQKFVAVLPREDRVRIEMGDELFSEYLFANRPRPCFFPILGSNGRAFTRSFPLAKGQNESQDHPHHNSLWFAHGDVNGVDFWHNPKARVQARQVSQIYSRPGVAGFTISSDWLGPDGKLVVHDRRIFQFQAHESERWLDFEINLTAPKSHAVKFGDTKEGTMALRVAAPMRVEGKVATGHLLNDQNLLDGQAWGKRSAWLLSTGMLAQKPASILMLEHPENFRYPTWWHAREYGLLAANPFGSKAFGSEGTGDFELPAGQTLRLRYRFIFANRTLTAAEVTSLASAFAPQSTPATHD